MASRYIGLGTIMSVDEDDSGATFTAITLCIKGTPPPRTRELIDGTALSDTLATYEMGIEQHSAFTFTQFWEPEDTMHASLDTLFGAKTQVIFTITYTTTSTVDSFEGIVSHLEPEEFTHNSIYQRKVTVQRKTATTRT
jgi:hypothetical protein